MRSFCISSWLPSWCPTSFSQLIKSEDRILKPIKVRFTQGHVPISNGNYIWTLGFNETESAYDISASGVQHLQVPLVLLHGFGGGVGLWVKNLSAFAGEGRPVYALDMLGFGRSSRPTFGRDAMDAEEQFVQSLEDWRKAEGLEHMILLGHDLGGYVSTAYALKYPQRLKHLVLVEPWGFAARPHVQEHWVPIWIKAIGAVMNPFNPLGPLRLAGPLERCWMFPRVSPRRLLFPSSWEQWIPSRISSPISRVSAAHSLPMLPKGILSRHRLIRILSRSEFCLSVTLCQ
ncbi:1-acylglycerol-3-phosphate O-acyltransferase ABHD5-like isoform X5 [Pseudorasbora parva]|uniref:1-acylglycerol-3-phosphate O-acyltransferase ABHD5-like isoform X5 n=1 Tax=Pseudorasbora parva TaxID=51549 RepID=UPI00351E5FF3